MAGHIRKLLERTFVLAHIVVVRIRMFNAFKFAYASFIAHNSGSGWAEGVCSNTISDVGQVVYRAQLFEIGMTLSYLIKLLFTICDQNGISGL